MKITILAMLVLLSGKLPAQTAWNMENVLKKINAERDFFNSLGEIYPPDTTIAVNPEVIDEVDCYWFTPTESRNTDLIIYLHGGSYAMGSLSSHKALVSHLSAKLQTKILFVDYSLAPERPFPHGRNDVVKVYSALRQRYSQKKILFVGDSAGAGLAVSGIAYINELGLKQPDGVILISPWIDLTCKNGSYESRKELDPILTRQSLQEYASYYLPENRAADNPSVLKFRHFPPTLIMVGSNEVLFDDARLFHNKIMSVQRNAEFKEYEGQTHVWLLTNISSQETVDAIHQMDLFLRTKIR